MIVETPNDWFNVERALYVIVYLFVGVDNNRKDEKKGTFL